MELEIFHKTDNKTANIYAKKNYRVKHICNDDNGKQQKLAYRITVKHYRVISYLAAEIHLQLFLVKDL